MPVNRKEIKQNNNKGISRNQKPALKTCLSARTKQKEEEKKMEETFTPVITKCKEYEKVKSKLQIKNNLSTLIKRIKEDKDAKEKLIKETKLRERVQEELQCTHKPKISPMPSYLKNIHHSKSPPGESNN